LYSFSPKKYFYASVFYFFYSSKSFSYLNNNSLSSSLKFGKNSCIFNRPDATILVENKVSATKLNSRDGVKSNLFK